MRNKIIAVNAVIVLIVGLLAFAIVRTQLHVETSSADQLKRSAQRDVAGAAAQLQLDGLRAERWLATKANEPATRAALGKATPDARGDAARQLADQIASAAGGAIGAKPSIVAVIDNSGKIVGRNGSDLNRGDDVASAYPAFKEAIAKGHPGSDVWTDKGRADQFIASYAPVRDESGRASGMIVIGVAINDALARVGDATTGRGVLLVSATGDVVASSANAGDDVKNAVKANAGDVKNAMTTGTSSRTAPPTSPSPRPRSAASATASAPPSSRRPPPRSCRAPARFRSRSSARWPSGSSSSSPAASSSGITSRRRSLPSRKACS